MRCCLCIDVRGWRIQNWNLPRALRILQNQSKRNIEILEVENFPLYQIDDVGSKFKTENFDLFLTFEFVFFLCTSLSLSLVCFFESVKINLNLMLRSVVHYTFQQHLRIFQVSIFLLFSRLNTVAFQNLLFTNISLFIWNFSSTTLSLSYFVWGRDRFGDQRLNSHFTVF